MKLINLAKANIKHGKSATASLLILIFLASMLLNLGITIITQINTFYDKKVNELHDAHVSIIVDQVNYEQSYEDFLSSYSGMNETTVEQVILMTATTFPFGESDTSSGLIFINADAKHSIAPLKLIEQLDTFQSNDIYLPYIFKAGGGHQLGDSITIKYQKIKYTYRIAGFFEAAMLGSNNMGLMKAYLPETAYNTLLQDLGEKEQAFLFSSMLNDQSQAAKLLNEFRKQFPQSQHGNFEGYFWGEEIEEIKTANTMTVNIIAIILVAFSAIIVIVSLIVIKFRVSNSIEDGMVNIGILKANGYSSNQIIMSMVIQFMSITIIAGVLGVASSYLIFPLFGGVISSLSGLLWTVSFNGLINLCSIAIVAILVLAVIFFSTVRIRKLTVVAALRGGVENHSFRKNHLPLDQTKGGIHMLLAGKTILANRKQNMMIAVIISAISFASVFSIVLYYNIAKDKMTFIHMVGSESANIIVQSNHIEEKFINDVEEMEGVEKTTILDVIMTEVDGQSFYTQISDDYGMLNNNTVYEGKYPQFDNEISISWSVAKLLDKGIGDTVTVAVGDHSSVYLVTGFSQSINFMGKTVGLTLPGIERLIPNYKATTINIYVKDVKNEDIIQILKAKYGDSLVDVIDVDETLKSQTGMYISAVFILMLVILITTMLVVILILYLVIKTIIVKRKKEFGILKAIGYTTLQLMNQIAWSFVPIVVIGVILGGVLGCLYTNKMLALLLSSVGIRSVHFVVNYPVVIIFCVSIIVLAYIVSMLVARKIKKISAYGLIAE